jgi:hypothetical protein
VAIKEDKCDLSSLDVATFAAIEKLSSLDLRILIPCNFGVDEQKEMARGGACQRGKSGGREGERDQPWGYGGARTSMWMQGNVCLMCRFLSIMSCRVGRSKKHVRVDVAKFGGED